MTKLPKRDVAKNTIGTCALRIESDYPISQSIDPVELMINHNLSQSLNYKRVEPQDAWTDFLKKVS